MPLSTRAQELVDIYDAIIAKGKGQSVTSAGHKGRQVAYAATSLKELVQLYRLLWTEELGEETGLKLLPELGDQTASRGLLRMRPFA